VRRAVEETLRQFGALQHLVNNAGIVLVKPLEECSEAEWDRVHGGQREVHLPHGEARRCRR